MLTSFDPDLFQRSLDAFKITDFERQIVNYHATYRSFFADKLLSPQDLEEAKKFGFYIGHHKTGLGEFLSYTPVPRYLKKHFPGIKVYVCRHRFAEALFRHNPFVDGVTDFPERSPLGTFREFGFGTHPQKRLRPFGIFEVQPVLPEIQISHDVRERWGNWKSQLPLGGRKLVMVQSSGRTNPKLFSLFTWWKLLRPLRDEFYFVQIGNLRDQFIWTHKVLLKQWDMEEMAGALRQGDAFVGPNSGVMHFAAAVGVNSVILHNEALASEMNFPTLGDNLALPQKVNHHLFHAFPHHYHAVVDKLFDPSPAPYAESLTTENLRRLLKQACLGPNSLWSKIEAGFHYPTHALF